MQSVKTVDEFLEKFSDELGIKNIDFSEENAKPEFFDITLNDVSEKIGGQVFKDAIGCASYIVYHDKLYSISNCFGGYGYDDIVLGYYMNKTHWSTVYLDGNVPQEVLADMIRVSHKVMLSSLSKKAQREIMQDIN